MFDDMMIGRLVRPATITVVIVVRMLNMGDGMYQYNDVMLYSNFELV
jgi:hypothetical protein